MGQLLACCWPSVLQSHANLLMRARVKEVGHPCGDFILSSLCGTTIVVDTHVHAHTPNSYLHTSYRGPVEMLDIAV